MTTDLAVRSNRLSSGKSVVRKSVFTARQWAMMARDKGLTVTAEAWDKAHDDGWDDENYCPLAAEEYRRKIVEARKSGK